MSGAPVLKVEDLHVWFDIQGGELHAVQGVSFDLRPGTTLGLVGESGCGKTTVLLALMGLLPAGARLSGGQVRYGDQVVSEFDARQWNAIHGREVGYVSQEPMNSLDPCFTVGSLLTEAVRRHTGVSRRDARVAALALLESVRLPDPTAVMGRFVSELSGGMAQRVGIALALAGNPRLLLADEPTSALDVTVRSEILALLKSLQTTRDMAVVVVTHDWTVVEDVSDYIAVMYAGEIVEYGATLDCLRDPQHPYTRGLLDSIPSRAEPGQPIRTIAGRVPSPTERTAGCQFANRCRFRVEACTQGRIPLTGPTPGHTARCIRIDEIAQSEVDDASVSTVA